MDNHRKYLDFVVSMVRDFGVPVTNNDLIRISFRNEKLE